MIRLCPSTLLAEELIQIRRGYNYGAVHTGSPSIEFARWSGLTVADHTDRECVDQSPDADVPD